MTTITFESDIDIKKKNFRDVQDFFETLSQNYDFSYEEHLEQKMQQVKNAPRTEFMNI